MQKPSQCLGVQSSSWQVSILLSVLDIVLEKFWDASPGHWPLGYAQQLACSLGLPQNGLQRTQRNT